MSAPVEAAQQPRQSKAATKHLSLQEREVHRYYQPWLYAHGTSLNVAHHVESLAKLDLHSTGYQPRISQDKALTAFAQLATMQMQVKRAMVSLIDSQNQMVLAEATYGTSIQSAGKLWPGSTVLARKDAICDQCMINTYTATSADGQWTWTAQGLVVSDCREDDRFKDRPYVQSEPGVRFYAGVPITSRSGVMIGVYAVSDEQPRDRVTAEEFQFMHETAQAVMEHLEWARDRVDLFKGDRIVRGMASFIESCTLVNEEVDPAYSSATTGDADQTVRATGCTEAAEMPASHSIKPAITVSRSSSARQRNPPPPRRTRSGKIDNSATMFAKAADILRESTIADGAAIFQAAPSAAARLSVQSTAEKTSNLATQLRLSPASDASGADPVTSDSDSHSPQARPCRVLAYSLASERAKAEIDQGTPLTLGTLEKYFQVYPKGHIFYFTDTGASVSSEDEGSASERESVFHPPSVPNDDGLSGSVPSSPTIPKSNRRSRRGHMDHKELLKKIPGAKSVVFLPLYDFVEEKLMAGCFLWTSVNGRMMNLDNDLSYLRAFGNSIMSEVARMRVQKNEAAKTTFIASMSHELRSPLHGILGAAEFLADTTMDTYQAGLATTIMTCGKTLLDTLNHVLDFSKINKLGRVQMRRNARQSKLVKLTNDSSLESINMTSEVDLGMLIEEVVEAVTAGHVFRKLQSPTMATHAGFGRTSTPTSDTGIVQNSSVSSGATSGGEGSVSVLLDISPRTSWVVRTQPGAIRRIIMNLFGNALKYTSSGFVAVSLRAQERRDQNKIDTVIRVVDSGKGISDEFQRNRLFVPFSQEDSFQPGTGLGLSIVKQIVDSLDGTIEVKSQLNTGTEVYVRLSLPAVVHEDDGGAYLKDSVSNLRVVTQGKRLVIRDPLCNDGQPRNPTQPIARLEQTISEVCVDWLGLHLVDGGESDMDILLYTRSLPVEQLLEQHKQGKFTSRDGTRVAVVIVGATADGAAEFNKLQRRALEEAGVVAEIVPQPCGPRKLAQIFERCLQRIHHGEPDDVNHLEEAIQISTQPERTAYTQKVLAERPHLTDGAGPPSVAVSFPSPVPLIPDSPSFGQVAVAPSRSSNNSPTQESLRVLVVDDNRINLQLLTMFMRKYHFSYSEAENGQEALDRYRESCLPGPLTSANGSEPLRRFDYVLMDISMPVMNGLEATRHIRDFEKENGLEGTSIIALTGLASREAQKEAQAAGVDVFLPKPVKFGELKKLLVKR